MSDLHRRPGETAPEHHRRLVLGKLVDGTLADADYAELAPYVYGKDYSTDVARRMMYGSRYTLELLGGSIEIPSSADERSQELDTKIQELQKARQRFFDQRREYNRMVSADGRREHLVERIVEAARNVSERIGGLYGERYTAPCDTGYEAVLVLCDWHYGLVTDNVWNRYDTATCIRRVKQIVRKAAEKLELFSCSKLHVIVLGDLIHGAIHTSARVASEELVCDQIMDVSEVLAQSINELSRYVDTVDVHITYGNHARTVQKKDDSIHRDNMERLIPWWLRERLSSNERVTVMPENDNEFVVLSVCGHDMCASHGDLDTVRSSTRLLPALLKKRYGCDIEYVVLADKHHRESFEELGVTSVLCGALCGTDDHANSKRLYSTPSQLLIVISEEGGIEDECRLRCD